MNPLTSVEQRVEVEGGAVHCERLGEGGRAPLILVHGGPGSGCAYLRSLAVRVASQRPVVIYDQLGCGASDRPPERALWTLPRFVGELQRVRAAMAPGPCHVLGHSWGSLLATEFALAQPPALLSLCLVSPCLNMPRVRADMEQLRASLPPGVQAMLRRNEERGTTHSAEYRTASFAFAKRHIYRQTPWPQELVDAETQWGRDVYEHMWGPAEFRVEGTLRDFNCTARLPELAVPTFVISGRHDEMLPETVASYAARIPGARHAIFEQSAHLPHLEEADRFEAMLKDFLLSADRGRNAHGERNGS